MSKYPEHEKMRAVRSQSQAIGSFLDWLDHSGYAVCEWEKTGPGANRSHDFMRTQKSIEQLLADYFEIDLKKISDEKDAMYASLRGEE